MHKKQYINNTFTLFIFILVTTWILVLPSLYKHSVTSINYNFIITNLLIGFISLFMLLKSVKTYKYSLHMIHWLFNYTFFFIAPLVQYLQQSFPWERLTSNNTSLLVLMNLFIIIWQILWIGASKLGGKLKRVEDNKEKKVVNISISNIKIYFLFIISIFVLLYQIYLYGFSGIFIRGSEIEGEQNNSTILLMFQFTGRAIPIVLLTNLIILWKFNKNSVNKIFIFFAILLALLTNFPTATPRFWTAAVFLGFFILFFKIKSRNLIVYILLIGLNVIFPLLATARRSHTLGEFLSSLDINRTLSANLLIADYDAYSMIGYTWEYIQFFGATYGNQLMTVLLFFIPRSWWSEKSIGSGKIVAEKLNFEYANVSSPLIAEGIINFSFLGIVVFAIAISFLTKKIDIAYWSHKNSLLQLVYPFWIGFFFFVLRGDLLSSLSYTLGFTITFILFRPKILYQKVS